ncbi:MAG: glycoside hydrolase family 43 protein, partial [Bacteroidota bacterium]
MSNSSGGRSDGDPLEFMSAEPLPDFMFRNPVFNHPAPDPYVLKHLGEYWGYATGFTGDGRAFGIIHSTDLVHWTHVGGAMEPLPGGMGCYWAPEVVYDNGRFLMYYSVGMEVWMQIRVAVADNPAGPFVDSGHILTREEFAIDAHLFVDEDGERYLFYATDFLQHTHIGTGTVMDRMLDPFTLAGNPQPVTRARYDWQIYDPDRADRGGVRWHTVEGPTVLKRKGIYFEMFSGGNWQNPSYGVSYATTDDIASMGEWEQAGDGERLLPILRTIPGKVIGPGHNSVVRGPDNRQLYCIYHRWAEDGSDRVLCIDRMDWVGDRMVVLGPSTEPQPAPTLPTIRGFDAAGGWQPKSGEWALGNGDATQQGHGVARLEPGLGTFLLEVYVKSDAADGLGRFGIALAGERGEEINILLDPAGRSIGVARGEEILGSITPPGDFRFDAFHLLRLEVNYRQLRFLLDGTILIWSGTLGEAASAIELRCRECVVIWAGLEITFGWEDLFMETAELPVTAGWCVERGSESGWRIGDRSLRFSGGEGVIAKKLPAEQYEVVVNVRLERRAGSRYGFLPAMDAAGEGGTITLES